MSAIVLTVILVAGSVFAADFKAKNGISFKYPAGWTPTETQQDTITSISVTNPSQPTIVITVAVSEGSVTEEWTFPTEEKMKESLAASGQDIKLITHKKIKVAGNDAALSEFSSEANGMYIQTRSVTFADGANLVAVTSVFMDKNVVAAGQKVAEGIENSLSLK
jgi:hypothetical protein